MALPVIPHVFRCSFNWTGTNIPRPAATVMHFSISSDDPVTLFNAFQSASSVRPWFQTTVDSVIHSVDITPLDGVGMTESFATTGTLGWVGNASSGDVSPATAVICKFLTAKRGRSYRGRMFMPWAAESIISNGKVIPASLTAGQTVIGQWWGQLTTAGANLQVASYTHGTAEPVTAVQVESLLGTQRKRQFRG